MSKIWEDSLIPRIKEFVLERINITASLRFPKMDLRQLHVYIRYQLDDIIIQFLTSMGTKIQDKNIHFNTFKRWQDHFKFTHRDKWWMRRWIRKHPIEFGKHKYIIQQCTVFPELEIPDFLKNEVHYVYYKYLEGRKI
jgi:hypothetical protein